MKTADFRKIVKKFLKKQIVSADDTLCNKTTNKFFQALSLYKKRRLVKEWQTQEEAIEYFKKGEKNKQ